MIPLLAIALAAADTHIGGATAADRDRLARAEAAWEAGLAAARRAAPGEIAQRGALFDPVRALPDAMPPAGDYRCRVFKLGAAARGLRDFTAYPWFACRVSAGQGSRRLEKLTGSQRFVGVLRPGRDDRATFLGTAQYGEERQALAYGRDRLRDMAGRVERVDDRRWRIALPWPAFESIIDVVELVPAR